MCVCGIVLFCLRSRPIFGLSYCNECFLDVEVGFMQTSDWAFGSGQAFG